jgi:hypothetical protein
MRIETKFLSLPIPVAAGSRFGDWQVTWIGGWTKHRLSYLVLVAKTPQGKQSPPIKAIQNSKASKRTS